MTLTTRQVCDLYTGLLAYQYKQGTKNRPALAIYLKQLLGDMLAKAVEDAFSIDTAVGPQLDILGKYIGLPRNIGDPVPRPYYQFSDYGSPTFPAPNGFTDYGDPSINSQAIWYEYQFSGTQNTDLSDAAYQFMLKMKIVLNSNDGTLASIMDLLQLFLAGIVALVDNANMTITYTISERTPVPVSVLQAYLPRTLGVQRLFDSVSGSAAPASRTKSVSGAGFQVVVSDPFTVTPVGGVGPYTYRWENVSGYNKQIDVGGPEGIFALQSGGPSDPAVVFWLQGFATLTTTGTWRCAIIDSRGIIGYTAPVTVNLSITP